MPAYHQFARKGFSAEVLPYTPDEILSDRVQNIAHLALASLNLDHVVGTAFPQLVLPPELLAAGSDREQRAGYAVYKAYSGDQTDVFFNPRIIERSKETEFNFEGCLSVNRASGLYLVERPKRIVVAALDLNAEPVELEAEGLDAVFHMHELRHLGATKRRQDQQLPATIVADRHPHSRIYTAEEACRLDPAEEAAKYYLPTPEPYLILAA